MPERLAEAARAGAEQALVVEAAPLAHLLEARRRLERADERGLGDSLAAAHEVEAPVDAVRAVDVGVPGRAEHRAVAGRGPAEAVARRIAWRRRPRPRRCARRPRRRGASPPTSSGATSCTLRAKKPRVSPAVTRRAARPRPASRSPRAACAPGARGRARSTRPFSASSAIRSANASASSSRLRAGARRPGPSRARIVRSVREATIGSAMPSTQTSVRFPPPRSSPRIGSSA